MKESKIAKHSANSMTANSYASPDLEARQSTSFLQNLSVLGMFAAMMATFIGGISLMSAAIDLLKQNNSTMVLLIVVVMLFGLLSLAIIVLLKWIKNIQNPKVAEGYRHFIQRLIFTFLLCGFIMGLGLYNHHNMVKKNKAHTMIDSSQLLIKPT